VNGIVAALTGRLGSGAELKYTANGSAMATFGVAVDDAKKAEGDQTEWIRATLWGETAEQLAPRLVKGTGVYLEGRLRLDIWTTREGENRATLKLSAWTCQPLGQIGRRRPKGDPVQLGIGRAGQSRPMPEALAVSAGRSRDLRAELDLDDPDADLPF